MSIRDIILGFDRSIVIKVIKVELRGDIWLNFALVTVKRCAVYMKIYRVSVLC
mgnify:CR=1 FL=1